MSKDRKKNSILKGGRAAENARLRDKNKFDKSSRAWLERQINDPFVKQSKKDGYRSRAVYKLQEIDDHFKIFAPGQRIVDLGAAPGSWCEYVVRKMKGNVTIVGVHLLPVKPLEHCIFIEGDFTELDILDKMVAELGGDKVDVVMSDIAPNACGHSKTDQLRIMYMLELALDFAVQHLRQNGSFVCKVLRGGSEKDILNMVKKHFAQVKHYKPAASRQDSKEMFLVAKGFRG